MQETIRNECLILGSGRFPGVGHGNPLQYSCLENPRDREAWRATVHKVTKSWTRLKRLSSSSSSSRSDLACMRTRTQVWNLFQTLSPSLCTSIFILYAEYIMRNAGLEEAQAGIKIAGRNTNNLRYLDDTTLMAESEEELKSLLMRVKEERKNLA